MKSESNLASSSKTVADTTEIILSRSEVIRRLRLRNEPIRLFAEEDSDSLARLKRLEILEPEVNLGLRNDFKAAMDKADEDFMKEIAEGQNEQKKKEISNITVKAAEHLENVTLDELKKRLDSDFGKDENKSQELILDWIKFVLKLWADELNSRPTEEKLSTKGRLERARHGQTEQYLKPLVGSLEKKSTAYDIYMHLVNFIPKILSHDYVKANEAYLEMAIGNSPWPIGVTMVGIHARPGREKVFSKEIAHVLNDETQRKYIQGIKRLITKMQQYYPNDPSKCVEFMKM